MDWVIGHGELERCAVVAHEDDECVFIDAVLDEFFHDLSHAVIHGGDHRECVAASLGHGAGEAIKVFFGPGEWHVRGEVGEVEEEGFILMEVDEAQGGIGLAVDPVALGADIAWFREPIALEVVGGGVAVELAAEGFLESAGLRLIRCGKSGWDGFGGNVVFCEKSSVAVIRSRCHLPTRPVT